MDNDEICNNLIFHQNGAEHFIQIASECNSLYIEHIYIFL